MFFKPTAHKSPSDSQQCENIYTLADCEVWYVTSLSVDSLRLFAAACLTPTNSHCRLAIMLANCCQWQISKDIFHIMFHQQSQDKYFSSHFIAPTLASFSPVVHCIGLRAWWICITHNWPTLVINDSRHLKHSLVLKLWVNQHQSCMCVGLSGCQQQ